MRHFARTILTLCVLKAIYTDYSGKNEDKMKSIFEKNNIYLSARQNKMNPPTTYYSANIGNAIPILLECWMKNSCLNMKIIANHDAIVPLVKDLMDKILN